MAGVGTSKPRGPLPAQDTNGGSFDGEDVLYGEIEENPYLPRIPGALLGERESKLDLFGEKLPDEWRAMTTPPSKYDPPGTQEDIDLQRLGPNNGAASSTFSPLDLLGYGARIPQQLVSSVARSMMKGHYERRTQQEASKKQAEDAMLARYKAERDAQKASEQAYQVNRERERMTEHLADLYKRNDTYSRIDESIGELAQKHGVAMDEVRRRVGAMNAPP